MPSIDIYTTNQCPYCKYAKDLLSSKGVDFNELNLDQDKKLRAQMITRKAGLRSVPQIFIDDQHIGGYDDLVALDKNGELDVLLNSSV